MHVGSVACVAFPASSWLLFSLTAIRQIEDLYLSLW